MGKCPFNFITFGNLPTSYLSSLSFEEQIFKIFEEIKQIEDYLEDFSIDEINKTITDLVNSKFVEIKSYIDNQDEKLYNYIDTELTNKINELTILLNQKVLLLMNYVDTKNIKLKTEILKYLQQLYYYIQDNFIKNIKIIDPTNSKLDDIQNVINNIYNKLRYHGITCLEFDTSGISCENFDNKNITALEFDLYSKDYFVINFNHYMYSPFTRSNYSYT